MAARDQKSRFLNRLSRVLLRPWALVVAIAALSYCLGAVIVTFAPKVSNAAELPLFIQGDEQPVGFADLVEHVSPAVVSIDVEGKQVLSDSPFAQEFPDPFGEFFRRFGDNAPLTRRVSSAGAGFIISADGYVVTNNHVIDSGQKITVTLNDGREMDADLVGTDADTDVALLKIPDAEDLPVVQFGDDDDLRVGDWVVAVGNPYGLGGTVTAGIVSAIGRDIGYGPYTDYIQIDAPINQGNSGGPTFDLSGRVVGMNSTIYSPSGGNVGIGFAIPASTVQAVVAQLQEHGSVSRGWLGVEIQDLTADIADSVGLADSNGAIVASVVPNSPAAKAAFREGDVILALDGEELDGSRDLTRRVAALRPGERATFVIYRDGRRQELTATIERRNEERLAGLGLQSGGNGDSLSRLGLTLTPLTPLLRQQYDIPRNVSGVLVASVDPESDAAQKGVSAGDVIARVGAIDVERPSDVEDALESAANLGRETVLVLVIDDNGQHFVALDISGGE